MDLNPNMCLLVERKLRQKKTDKKAANSSYLKDMLDYFIVLIFFDESTEVKQFLMLQLLLLWGFVSLTKMQFRCSRPAQGPSSFNNCHCYEVLTTNIKA